VPETDVIHDAVDRYRPASLPSWDALVAAAGRQRRRKQRASVGLAAAAVLVVVGLSRALLPSSGEAPVSEPLAVERAADLRQAIADGAYLRTVAFDAGALRIDPPADRAAAPLLSQADALALARSRFAPGAGTSLVRDVTVARGTATVGIPIEPDGVSLQPPVRLSLLERDVWVIAYENDGPHSCPLRSGRGSEEPEPVRVLLIAADDSSTGVAYGSAGAFCDRDFAASARPAYYSVSVPFSVTRLSPSRVRLTGTAPRCGAITTSVGPSAPGGVATLAADVVMLGRSCTGGGETDSVDLDVPRDTEVVAGPLGLAGSLVSGDRRGLSYFDGEDRTVEP
jgi:hypothetical protein